ncbi:MAG: glutamate 5-kinase [Rhodospirillales bacterium]|nr:glutamate 5-kinase [Rhodospirillales bacterium]MCW8969872.1 glutamate 5-kinase [Rhodospirillales bacterium]MCW9001985.1 glutamate 5-kinase [Rhodospirillales bacterium]
MTPHRTGTDLAAGKRVVIKIGSALLVDEARGTVHRQWLEALAEDVAAARERGQEVVLVSSGAIAVGRRHLNFPTGSLSLEQKQAAAAAGMVRLVHAYQEVLGHYGITVAQVLLTLDDSENRRRYINARNTLDTLIEAGAVPLINENDTVATDEIRFGDNDRLAARVSAMISADTLVLLSDIDGLYTADPTRDPNATFIPEVHEITPEIEAMGGKAGTDHGSGGMVTKLAAARICLGAGCRMVIARGNVSNPLKAILDGAPCTWFLPSASPGASRKQWIRGSLKTVGSLRLDAGALKALHSGRSLLPAGVTAIEGKFPPGSAVAVLDADGNEVARGISAYSSDEARKIMGRKSSDIETILGYRRKDELIHRDDLVLT